MLGAAELSTFGAILIAVGLGGALAARARLIGRVTKVHGDAIGGPWAS